MDKLTGSKSKFKDNLVFNIKEKTLVSFRDGVLDYYGIQLGMQPYDKLFKVYRDPIEVMRITPLLVGLPITDDHIDMDVAPYNIIGTINTSNVETYLNPDLLSTVAIRNTADIVNEQVIENKNDLSLGFFADLEEAKESDPFDFKQVNIVPHHVASVEEGRCGDKCKFGDEVAMSKKTKAAIKDSVTSQVKKFTDKLKALKDGETMTLRELSEMIMAFPEDASYIDLDLAKELTPFLAKVAQNAEQNRTKNIEAENKPAEITEDNVTTESTDLDELETEDEEGDADPTVKETKTEDEESYIDADDEEDDMKKVKSMDSKSLGKFIDSKIQASNKEFASVMGKAKDFLDSTYKFQDKTVKQIMRDALATQYSEKFTDAELSTAFKLLQKNGAYKDFGKAMTDAQTKINEVKNFEMGGN
jgi:hypothetical protein